MPATMKARLEAELISAVQHYCPESPDAVDRVRACMQQSIPATVRAVLDACVTGKWTEPVIPSRRAMIAEVRASRAAAEAQPHVVPSTLKPAVKTGKK